MQLDMVQSHDQKSMQSHEIDGKSVNKRHQDAVISPAAPC
jgi:hypothetical protein